MDIGPIEKCAVRIAKALSIRGMRQYELCQKTKIPKSAMSQYISGAFEPKQDRIYLISQALNVDPVWLMGYDVPMGNEEPTSTAPSDLTACEKIMLELFRQIPDNQQQMLIRVVRGALGTKE